MTKLAAGKLKVGIGEIPVSGRPVVKVLPYTGPRRRVVQRGGWFSATARPRPRWRAGRERSVGAPQHAGQLLALWAHREPLRVPDRLEAAAAEGDHGATFDRGARDLVLAGVVGIAVVLTGVGVGLDRSGLDTRHPRLLGQRAGAAILRRTASGAHAGTGPAADGRH